MLFGTSFRALSYIEYMKKIQPKRLEAWYCNADDTRARSCPKIQAKVLYRDNASN